MRKYPKSQNMKPSAPVGLPATPPMSTPTAPGISGPPAAPMGAPPMAPGPKFNPDNQLPTAAFHKR